ncbi:solute carrier organic anion transporter family member 5A1 [Caerostris extrusa]|uniref:Solute carrier organic anion transporter family member 5A1 n=1 Tax=Caerostris extrusa TaxID=172846 RepID=A0AAV4NKP2_CAEEX|nr:solute carrier organic anion transporter family member 5A1 [Caerostris extrusa]
MRVRLTEEMKFSPVPTEEGSSSSEIIINRDYLCGIGRFKPRWLQRFADPKKRFAFDSTVSGFILIADSISAAVLSLVVGYFGGKSTQTQNDCHWNDVSFSVSCFVSTLPYFIYGPSLHFLSRDILRSKKQELEYCNTEFKEEECNKSSQDADVASGHHFVSGEFVVRIWLHCLLYHRCSLFR